MSLEENKAIVRSFMGALNEQDLSSLDDLVATDLFDHTNQFRGLETVKQTLKLFYRGFPDAHFTIEDIIAEGERVWISETEIGTHNGEYLGISPTGKKITISTVSIYRVVDGKIAEAWHVYDNLDFYKQLGIIEYTEEGKKLFPEDVK